jgi:PAS domain S-box-containing protein
MEFASNDPAMESVLVSVTDISDRKRVEEALRRSETYWRELADRAPAMLWMTSPDARCTYLSRRWIEFTGMPLEQGLGFGWLKTVHPEDREHAREVFESANEQRQTFAFDCRVRRYDGEWRWAIDIGEPRFGRAGEFLGYIGKVIDITERKLAENELRRSNEELRRANAELEEFAYVASHDLQEPLRTVNIYTQMLLRKHVPNTLQAQQYAEFVSRGVQRMEELLRDLLSYSRTIHSDGQATDTADLSAALNRALAVLKTRIDETQTVVHHEPLPAVCGDESQLTQVFQNLLSNAIKYRKPGEAPVVWIRGARSDREVVVSLRDNGIGFENQYAERIFGLFKRLHKDQFPGTGLGLAICKRIVERYGGRIWAESQPGVGSTFYFGLTPAPKRDTPIEQE